MSTLLEATIEAVRDSRDGHGQEIVDCGNGDYMAIPTAYLNDISYIQSREVIISLSNGLDDTGWDHLDEMSDEEIAQLLIDTQEY